VASLGLCQVRFFASKPVKTIPRHRGMSCDLFNISLSNLVDIRYIKCTCKKGNWTSFSGKKKEKIINSDQTTRRLVHLLYIHTQNGDVLGLT